MEITEELINRYFLQECSADERAVVSAWFYAHPEELDKYLADASWQQFEVGENLPSDLSVQMLEHIQARIEPAAPVIKPMRRFDYRWIAAASIIFILGIGWLFLLHRNNLAKPVVAIAKASATIQVNDTVSNRTERVKEIALQDGSVVTLSTGSRIIFNKNFIQPHRDIQLTGEAIFKVAKDKTRPFTVFAGGLSTTALGTRFKVTAYNNNNKVRVMLYNGKVVVKQHEAAGAKVIQDVYLTPGMQLMWERGDQLARVSNFINIEQNTDAAAEVEGKTLIAGEMISFQNQSLEKVIATLRSAYDANIQADKALLAHHTYTGTVNLKTEAPGDVLKTIATLNGLTLTREKDDYELTH